MGSLHNQWSDCQRQYQYQLHYLQRKNNCMVWNETCCGTTTGFPVKRCQRNVCRGSILMTYHYPDLGSASDWSYHKGKFVSTNQSTTQIREVTRHQYRFLHLFLRYHITGKPVVSPQNVGCFPRLSVGWVPLALFCHLVLTSDYKNYMMFSNSPSGVCVNNVHGGTLRELYQIYNRNNATLTAFSWTFLYYHQKKKQFYILQGVK